MLYYYKIKDFELDGMTITLTGVTVDTGVPAQNVRAPVNPVISTAGNDVQAISRQQLQSAVPAPVLLGAYSTGITQQKPAAKSFTSIPSSGFAAQFIAQGDAGSDDDLAIFVPLQVTSPAVQETPADDYVNELRIARGDLGSAKAAPTQVSEQMQQREAVQNAKPATTAATESSIRSGITQLASVVSQFIRRPNLLQAKGVGAYQVAQTRTALLRPDRLATTAPTTEPVN